jgi:transcriptional regulator with GAF, ATPase, and Fis domain
MKKDVSERRFRADLWYRLNVFPITLPPLRERRDDIPLLVQYYLDLFSKKQGKHIASIPARIIQVMQRYNWPGNVRELANIIERAVISTSGSKLQLAEELKQHNEMETEEFKSFHDMERDYIIKVLEKTNWKISGANSAAEILRLDRSTLRNKMKKLDIRKP